MSGATGNVGKCREMSGYQIFIYKLFSFLEPCVVVLDIFLRFFLFRPFKIDFWPKMPQNAQNKTFFGIICIIQLKMPQNEYFRNIGSCFCYNPIFDIVRLWFCWFYQFQLSPPTLDPDVSRPTGNVGSDGKCREMSGNVGVRCGGGTY